MAMGQIPRSTERIFSFKSDYFDYDYVHFVVIIMFSA